MHTVHQNKAAALRKIAFFQGLSDEEMARVGTLCQTRAFAAGEICQSEGQYPDLVQVILSGRVGEVLHIPNYSLSSGEIVIDSLGPGELFGWSALIKSMPWSTLKVIDQARVLCLEADELLSLCGKNDHLGYIVMRNLATLISFRLRRNRIFILNAIAALKSEA